MGEAMNGPGTPVAGGPAVATTTLSRTTLSKAAARDLVHTRQIVCRGYRRADGLWDIEGTMEDSKAYSFANHDRGGIAAGEPLHRMHIRLTLDDDLVVQVAEAVTEAAPYSICGDVTSVFAALVGLQIGPGWRRQVLARMQGVRGCTHLTELLLGPMTTTAVQTILPIRRREATADSARPPVPGTCYGRANTR